ncbi:hypothetical protein Pelo_291 [Pelomyxa schiedti]|nr:hypothetical protein Pelo_291 [Pelomyxa schiedti]
MWVIWPERRVLVGFAGEPSEMSWDDESPEYLFFSVSPTLGIVHEPAKQLLSSAPSPTFSLMAEESSCFPSAHAGQVHHFVPGSMVAGGCGIIVSSALSMHSVQPGQRGVTLFKTKDPAAANFCSPRVQISSSPVNNQNWDGSRSTGGCYISLLPHSVLVDYIGKMWVMRPERNVLVEFNCNPTDTGPREYTRCEYRFFSVSPTLGIVHEPVQVVPIDSCIGWLGGNRFLEIDGDENEVTVTEVTKIETQKPYNVSHIKYVDSCISILSARGTQACCNKKWVVVAGTEFHTKETGLFVYKVENAQVGPCCRVTKYPWIDSVMSLRFFGSSEYDFESDVVEAIVRDGDNSKLWKIFHISIESESDSISTTLRVISECKLPRKIPERLIYRSDSMYYLLLPESCPLAIKVLILNTGAVITLLEWWPTRFDFDLRTVDGSHLCVLNSDCSVASVYSLPELLSSASSSTPSSPTAIESSCFPNAPASKVHQFVPGSAVASGCGLIIASSLSMHTRRHTIRPVSMRDPEFKMEHKFIDATTGVLIFTMSQGSAEDALLPTAIKAVPFTSPFCASQVRVPDRDRSVE